MCVALVTATMLEMKAALKHFEETKAALSTLAEGSYVECTIGRHPLLLLVTGVGPINASLTLGKLFGNQTVSGVMCLGVAGSFDMHKHPLGSVRSIHKEIWPEFGLIDNNGVNPKGIGLAQCKHEHINQGKPVWDTLEWDTNKAFEKIKLHVPLYGADTIPVASSLTVAGVSGTPERARQLQDTYHADLENMEGFALAYACARDNVPFLQVRTVSNRVGSRDKKDWNLKLGLEELARTASNLFTTIVAA